jgi:hypothetical protein
MSPGKDSHCKEVDPLHSPSVQRQILTVAAQGWGEKLIEPSALYEPVFLSQCQPT